MTYILLQIYSKTENLIKINSIITGLKPNCRFLIMFGLCKITRQIILIYATVIIVTKLSACIKIAGIFLSIVKMAENLHYSFRL